MADNEKPYQLYWRANTGAYVVEVVLELCGAAWQRIDVMSERDPKAQTASREQTNRKNELAELNPLKQVPLLILPDGTALTESVAMILHLCDCHPQSGLLPEAGSTERAKVYRWLLFLSTNIYDACLRHYYSDRYIDNPAMSAEVKSKAHQHLDKYWNLTEQQLSDSPTVVGTELSLADIYIHMLQSWYPDPEQLLARCPKVANISANVHAQPTIARIDDLHARIAAESA